MKFKIEADVTRTVEETVRMDIEAENADEALEIADEYINGNDPKLDRMLVTTRFFHQPEAIQLRLL